MKKDNIHYKYEEKKLSANFKKIESRALVINTILNLVLSIIEILFFVFTDSISILFDGVFSLSMTLTSAIALLLSFFINKNSFNYPLGRSIYDNIFSLFKSLLVIVISVFFLYDSISAIIDTCKYNVLDNDVNNKNIYIAYITTACFMSLIITLIYFIANKKIENKSILLNAEIKSSIIDFSISFFIGISLVISSFIANNQDKVRSIIDNSLIIILVSIMIPIIVKSFIVDLLIISGYRMFKDEEIELKNHLNDLNITDIYIKRHNEQKIFLITLKLTNNDLDEIKKKISSHIYEHYSENTKIIFII